MCTSVVEVAGWVSMVIVMVVVFLCLYLGSRE